MTRTHDVTLSAAKGTTPVTAPFTPFGVTSACQRCGFPVASRPFGCKNPCRNCGTVYPLGDCSD